MTVNIASPEHKANPFPFYARLRAESPAIASSCPTNSQRGSSLDTMTWRWYSKINGSLSRLQAASAGEWSAFDAPRILPRSRRNCAVSGCV
jgi:hypothetical protein